jgi:hypothetical protein
MTWSLSKSRALVIVTILAATLLSLSPVVSQAQVYGVWSNPTPVPKGQWLAGGNFLVGDLVGIMGQVRSGINEKTDFGVQLGIPDFDLDFGIGGDVRYLVMPASDSFPMDLVLNGALGYTMGPIDVLDIDFGGIVGKGIPMESGYTITPYGALMFAIGRASAQGFSNTDFDVHFRGGADFAVNELFTLNGELQLSSRSNSLYFAFGAAYRFGDI